MKRKIPVPAILFTSFLSLVMLLLPDMGVLVNYLSFVQWLSVAGSVLGKCPGYSDKFIGNQSLSLHGAHRNNIHIFQVMFIRFQMVVQPDETQPYWSAVFISG